MLFSYLVNKGNYCNKGYSLNYLDRKSGNNMTLYVIMLLTVGCPTLPSDLMTEPVALMRIGGNPDLVPAVMKHNADALLNDRDKLIRWQKWYEKDRK